MSLPCFKLKKCFAKNLTWLGVGGPVQLFKPKNVKDLSAFIKANDFFTIGARSNILASENINKHILRLGRVFNYIYLKNNEITAGGAALDTTLARFALENEIGGFEFLSVIPGTVGGAVAMNTGAYGYEISQVLQSVSAVNENGEILCIDKTQIGFTYRGNTLPKQLVFFKQLLRQKKKEKDQIKQKMTELIKKSKIPNQYKAIHADLFLKTP